MSDEIPIYTIGYGSRTLEEFIGVLEQNEIRFLVDVRSIPFSRYKPEFSKPTLSEQLEMYNIRYVFMGDELGGRPKEPSLSDQNGKVDYNKVEKTSLYQSGIKRLINAFDQQQSIVLMCSEGKPEDCHRSKLIGETLAVKNKIRVMHVDENNNLVPHGEVIERVSRHERQGSLFSPDEGYRSRKKYLQ